ncbi:MAG TPA: YbaK/EbsC family protein [Candidatus Paceibacterota bacterium]
MKISNLEGVPVMERQDLLAKPVADAIRNQNLSEVEVVEIDPSFADTASFCENYKVGLNQSANCVVIETKREGTIKYVTCMVLATTKADVNNLLRKHMDVRKASFAKMDEAIALTGMEYGGITPIGLPSDWVILVDSKVTETPYVIIGSGIRKSKLIVPGKLLASLPNAAILTGLGIPK